jgi:hypothetical protein
MVVESKDGILFPVHSHLLRLYTGLFSSVFKHTDEFPKEVKVPFSERSISIVLGFLYDPLCGNSLYIEYEPECMEMADYLNCSYFIGFAERVVKEKVLHVNHHRCLPYGLLKTWLNVADTCDLKVLRAACIERLTQIVVSQYSDDRKTQMTLVLDVLASVSSKTTAREIIGLEAHEFTPLWTGFAMTTVPEYNLPENHNMHIIKGFYHKDKDEFQFKACGLLFDVHIDWEDTGEPGGEITARLSLNLNEDEQKEYLGKRFRVTLGLYDFVNRCLDRTSEPSMSCTYVKVDTVFGDDSFHALYMDYVTEPDDYPRPYECWQMTNDFSVHNLNAHGDPGIIAIVETIV